MAMRQECIQAVSNALGRTISAIEAKAIEDRMARNMRAIAAKDPQGWQSLSKQDQMTLGAAEAAKELVFEANKKKQRVALTILAHDRIAKYIDGEERAGRGSLEALEDTLAFRGTLKGNTQSVESRVRAIANNTKQNMMDVFESVNPKWFGLVENNEGIRLLTKAIFQEPTGNAATDALGMKWLDIANGMREQFNRFGGEIRKLEEWAIPQHHDQKKVAEAGKDQWVQDTLPLLRRERYTRDDGSRMDDAEVTSFLEEAWLTLATGGVNKLEAGRPKISGMLAKHGSEARSIHFKNSDAYLNYQQNYGDQNLFQIINGHIDAMAKDIGLVETFGPNPDNTFNLFKDKAFKKETIAVADNFPAQQLLKLTSSRLDREFDMISGTIMAGSGTNTARFFDSLKNLISAAKLGSAPISAIVDQGTMHLTAKLNGLPSFDLLKNQLKTFNPANSADRAVLREAGLGIDAFLSHINRFGDETVSNNFAAKFASSIHKVSFMTAMDQANRQAFGLTMMGSLARVTKEKASIFDLPAIERRVLESKGIDDNIWKVWKLATPEDLTGVEAITPRSIARIPDADLVSAGVMGDPSAIRRDALLKLTGLIMDEGSMAIVQVGVADRAAMGSVLPTERGTLGAELWRSIAFLKSFPITNFKRHILDRGIRSELPTSSKAMYLTALVAGTTVLGAAADIVSDFLAGKDPKNYNPFNGDHAGKSWMSAFFRGGSLGLYGDLILKPVVGEGSNMTTIADALAGPVLGQANLLTRLGQHAMQGDGSKTGAELVKTFKGVTPFANLWYTKAITDHLLFNQLQEYFSQGYSRKIEGLAQKQYGQSFYWRPNETVPDRAPNLKAAIGD